MAARVRKNRKTQKKSTSESLSPVGITYKLHKCPCGKDAKRKELILADGEGKSCEVCGKLYAYHTECARGYYSSVLQKNSGYMTDIDFALPKTKLYCPKCKDKNFKCGGCPKAHTAGKGSYVVHCQAGGHLTFFHKSCVDYLKSNFTNIVVRNIHCLMLEKMTLNQD